MPAKRPFMSRIWPTWVKPASRNPSSRMAARIGLSSTMTILGDCSALIDHSPPGRPIHSTPTAAIKPCNYEKLGLARPDQSGRCDIHQPTPPKLPLLSLAHPQPPV